MSWLLGQPRVLLGLSGLLLLRGVLAGEGLIRSPTLDCNLVGVLGTLSSRSPTCIASCFIQSGGYMWQSGRMSRRTYREVVCKP